MRVIVGIAIFLVAGCAQPPTHAHLYLVLHTYSVSDEANLVLQQQRSGGLCNRDGVYNRTITLVEGTAPAPVYVAIYASNGTETNENWASGAGPASPGETIEVARLFDGGSAANLFVGQNHAILQGADAQGQVHLNYSFVDAAGHPHSIVDSVRVVDAGFVPLTFRPRIFCM